MLLPQEKVLKQKELAVNFKRYCEIMSFDIDSYKSCNNIFRACLHDQNKSGFFGGSAFIRLIRAIEKVFKKF